MLTTRTTKRAAGIAAVAVLFMGAAATAAGAVLPLPFGDEAQQTVTVWRHDGAAVTSGKDAGTAVSVAADAPAPTRAAGTVLERATLACTVRDDDDATQSALDLAAAAEAAGVTEDEFCSMVDTATRSTTEGGRRTAEQHGTA